MKRDHIMTPRTDVHPQTRNTNNQNSTEVSQFPGHCSQRRSGTRAGCEATLRGAGGCGPHGPGAGGRVSGGARGSAPAPRRAPSRRLPASPAASGVSANVPCQTGVSPGRTQMSRCDLSKALPVGRCGVFGGGALLGRRAAPVGSEPPGAQSRLSPRSDGSGGRAPPIWGIKCTFLFTIAREGRGEARSSVPHQEAVLPRGPAGGPRAGAPAAAWPPPRRPVVLSPPRAAAPGAPPRPPPHRPLQAQALPLMLPTAWSHSGPRT